MPKHDLLTYYLRLLARREYSVAQLREKAKNKGHETEQIKKTLAALKREGAVDDERYARSWLHDRLQFRPVGSFFARRELFRAGLDEQLIDRLIKEYFSPEEEKKRAKILAKRKLANSKERPYEKQYASLSSYLANKGFPAGVVAEVTREVL